MISITCGHCGHNGDFDAFTYTTVSGDLPPGIFQCPHCRCAWTLKKIGEARPICDRITGEIIGVIPPDCKVVEVDSRL